MVEGIAVAASPVVANECRDEQKEGASWLMEICYQSADDVVFVSWSNEELRVAEEGVGVVALHPLQHVVVGLKGADAERFELVGVPLQDVHGLQVGVVFKLYAEPVDRLEGANCCGAYGNDGTPEVCDDMFEVGTVNLDLFHMHCMFANGVGRDGFEGAGADVEGDVFGFETLGA